MSWKPAASRLRSRGVLSLVRRLVPIFLLLICLPYAAPSAQAQNASKNRRKVIETFDPEYPTILKTGHFQGQVHILATVLPNGTVTKTEVAGGNPMLAQYAAKAVLRWKYAPGPAQTVEDAWFNFTATPH